MTRECRVLIVDDHPLWRDAIARDLDVAGFAVTGEAGDGEQALRVAAATQPDIVLLDLQLPGRGGVEVTRALCSLPGPLYVLIFSASGESDDVLSAVEAGAMGYLVKSATRNELITAVGAAQKGEPVFTPGLASLVLGAFRDRDRARASQLATTRQTLSPRELDVLRHVATGLSYRQAVVKRVDQARVDRILADHDPFQEAV
jgi:DNA-binding NarL/FixJ family response regulator